MAKLCPILTVFPRLASWSHMHAQNLKLGSLMLKGKRGPLKPVTLRLQQLPSFSQVEKGTEWDRVAGEAARTVPGRENGGNCDIKNLSRGCKVYFPVFVEGANLSMGDMHFSQGDGEVSFCGAIEMSGFLELK